MRVELGGLGEMQGMQCVQRVFGRHAHLLDELIFRFLQRRKDV